MITPMILDTRKKTICWFEYNDHLMLKHTIDIKGCSDRFLKIILLLSDNMPHDIKDISNFLKVKEKYAVMLMCDLCRDSRLNIIQRIKGYIMYDHIELTY